jgi:hypothetical protein
MSRSPGGPDGSTGIGTTTAGTSGEPASTSAPRACGTSSGASRNRRRSTGRCHTPCRPGRFAAPGASNRIAPGRGHSSAAVTVQYTSARGRCSSMPERAAARAESAHTKSVNANVRTSRRGRAATTATDAPARCNDDASSKSAARSPAVEPNETSRTSATLSACR